MADIFYIAGIGLTLAALALSFVGLRREGFPASRGAFAAVLVGLGALVAATCAFGVVLAREEQQHREEELAHAAEEQAGAAEQADAAAAGEQGAGGSQGAGGGDVEAEPPPAEELELTSPADGGLVFEPDRLRADAGLVRLVYTNPSPVPHNVAIEVEGETVTESETVTDGATGEAEAELEPGEYVFFCAIPGHREAGMEGPLTVR